MMDVVKKFLLLFFLLVIRAHGYAQWQETNGPISAQSWIFCITIKNPANIFIGTNSSGIYKSTDYGLTWNELVTSPNNGAVVAITVNGDNIYAATSSGIFLSADSGSTWVPRNNGLGNLDVHSFLVHGTNLYAGTASGLFKSTDSAASWTLVLAGNIQSLASIGTLAFACVRGVGMGRVYVSNGSGWTQVSSISSLGFGGPKTLLAKGQKLFLTGTNNNAVYVSSDSGSTWTPYNTGLPPGFPLRAITSAGGSTILMGADMGYGSVEHPGHGIFKSTDDGVTWSQLGLNYYIINDIAIDGNNIFAATHAGVFFSADNGATWTARNVNLPRVYNVLSLLRHGNAIYAGNGNTYVSLDNGDNWALTPSGSESYAFASNNTYVYTGGDVGGNYRVRRTTDNGWSWSDTSIGSGPAYIFAIAAMDSIIFAGKNGGNNQGLYRSVNNGNSFTYLPAFANDHIRLLMTIGNRILAVPETNAAIFYSVNAGLSWTSATPNFLDTYAFAVNGSNIYAGTLNGVYVSADSGATWTPTGSIGMTNNDITALAVYSNTIIAATAGPGGPTYYSTNGGASWTFAGYASGSASIPCSVLSLFVDSGYVLAGTDNRGVIKKAVSDFPVSVENVENGEHFSISPNPATNEFTIYDLRFTISKVEMYNVLGEKIYLQQPVTSNPKQVTISVSDFTPGVYFVKLISEQSSVTRRIVVQR